MKKVLFVLTVLIAACMICSCGGGHGGSDSSAQNAVAVGFNIDVNDFALKALNVHDHDYSNIEIWYKATPKWESAELGTIQGITLPTTTSTTPDFIKLTDTVNDKFVFPDFTGEVGYFAQGKWEFEIEVRMPNSTDNTYAVLWKTSSPKIVYINENNKSIIFTVAKNIDANKTGSIIIDKIKTNKKSTTDYFEVSYAPLTGGTSTSIEIGSGKPLASTGTGDDTADYAELSGTVTGIPAGFYAITVKYFSAPAIADPATPAKLVGKSTVAAEIIPGDPLKIYGTIENQEYQQTTFAIKGMYKLGLTVTASKITGETTVGVDDLATVAVNTPVTFKAVPSVTDLGGTAVTDFTPSYKYIWNNESPVDGATDGTSTYSFTPTTPGAYYVDCIVYYMDGTTVVGSAFTKTFRFKAE